MPCDSERAARASRAYNKDNCLYSTESEGILELRDDDVASFGPTLPFEIFRTGDGRGWGLRSSAEILSGQFVCEYVGETVTNEEARPLVFRDYPSILLPPPRAMTYLSIHVPTDCAAPCRALRVRRLKEPRGAECTH